MGTGAFEQQWIFRVFSVVHMDDGLRAGSETFPAQEITPKRDNVQKQLVQASSVACVKRVVPTGLPRGQARTPFALQQVPILNRGEWNDFPA